MHLVHLTHLVYLLHLMTLPQPSVGMRLYKWTNTHRNPKNHDEPRTAEHNTFRP